MRWAVLMGLAFAAGCSGGATPPPPAPTAKALSEKEIEAIVAKRVAEELKKREPKEARQPVKPEEKPKEMSFNQALVAAGKIVEDMREDDLNAALGRLTPEERISVTPGLTREAYQATHPQFRRSVIDALRAARLNKIAAKRLAESSLGDKGFENYARIVWDKVPSFRNPAALASAAQVYQQVDLSKDLFNPFRHFPPSTGSGPIDDRSRDFWESFSGVTWDKLK